MFFIFFCSHQRGSRFKFYLKKGYIFLNSNMSNVYLITVIVLINKDFFFIFVGDSR